MQIWKFDSSKGEKDKYSVVLADDGRLACNCHGCVIKKDGKHRRCTHTDDVMENNGLKVEIRDGEWMYVVGSPILQPQQPKVEKLNGMPHGYVNPMLAIALTGERGIEDFKDDEWTMEEKYDGHRVVVYVDPDGNVSAWSRPKEGKVGNKRVLAPHLIKELSRFPDVTLDGELDTTGKSYGVTRLDQAHLQRYLVFDILKWGDVPSDKVCALTQAERRVALERVFATMEAKRKKEKIKDKPSVILAPSLPLSEDGLQAIWDRGGEGVILKRKAARYRPGARSADWVKIKKVFAVGSAITGFEQGENGPYSKAVVLSDEGVETTVKVRNAKIRREIEKNPKNFIGMRLIIGHYGKTPAGKYRGPIIWDHFAGEGE
jgi:ATP-dependent DNA ligase